MRAFGTTHWSPLVPLSDNLSAKEEREVVVLKRLAGAIPLLYNGPGLTGTLLPSPYFKKASNRGHFRSAAGFDSAVVS